MYNAASQAPHAGFISRSIAFVADAIVVSVAALAAVALVQSLVNFFTLYGVIGQRALDSAPFRTGVVVVTTLMAIVVGVGYPVGSWVLWGQTLGKLMMGIRVTRADGTPLRLRDALLRYVGYWISLIPLGLGFFWVLVDDQRQAWHDKLAGSYVVYDVRALSSRRSRVFPRLSS